MVTNPSVGDLVCEAMRRVQDAADRQRLERDLATANRIIADQRLLMDALGAERDEANAEVRRLNGVEDNILLDSCEEFLAAGRVAADWILAGRPAKLQSPASAPPAVSAAIAAATGVAEWMQDLSDQIINGDGSGEPGGLLPLPALPERAESPTSLVLAPAATPRSAPAAPTSSTTLPGPAMRVAWGGWQPG